MVVVACRQVAGDHDDTLTWKLEQGGSRRGLNCLTPVEDCCGEGGSFLSLDEYRNSNSPPPPALCPASHLHGDITIGLSPE